MGVNKTDWIIVGTDIGYKHIPEDYDGEFDEYDYQSAKGKLTYLIDWMSGDYFIVGEVIKSNLDYYSGIHFDFSEISSEEINDIKERVKQHIRRKFNIEVEPNVIIRSHFS